MMILYRIVKRLIKEVKFIRRSIIYNLRLFYVPYNLEHVFGPANLDVDSSDLVVVSLMRDVENQIKSFIRYYQRLGCKHIVLIDNGSVDNTVSYALQFENVTIFKTALSFKDYKRPIKRYLSDNFGKNCWCLVADIDERFDYPCSDQISLTDFLHYLNVNGYSGVTVYMLDMFSDRPLNKWPNNNSEPLEEICKWYDVSSISKYNYGNRRAVKRSRISNHEIKIYRGGIRKKIFGHDALLIKHPLLFRSKGAKMLGHFCGGAYIADISCVIYHYKFDSEFLKKCTLAVKRESYGGNSRAYKAYLKKIINEDELVIKSDTAEELLNVNQLVENGFLVISEQFLHFVKNSESNL